MNDTELGARIKTFRRQKGLSQEALAEQLEVSHQAVAKWESGQSRPSTANLLALCGVFEVSLDTLVTGEKAAAPEPAPAPAPEPRHRRAGPAALSALTLLSLAFSTAVTLAVTFQGTFRDPSPSPIIGGADGPTAILVAGPVIDLFPMWALTAGLAVATAVVFLRGRRKK